MSDPGGQALRPRLQSALNGRYLIDRELGRGGMAVVYLADDLRHQRRVALKVLTPEIAAAWGEARFLREIQLAARLHHPNILPLHDSGVANGLLYYVMPYVEGESLRQRLDRERQLSVGQAVSFTRSLAGALSHAHQRGVIHRDIKPENILIQDEQPLLADFGIALAPISAGGNQGEGRLTGTGLSLGTPSYMSPEQAAGERDLDARSDIYSLAAVAYEMLVGQPPHTGVSERVIVSRVLADPVARIRTVRGEVPPGVEAAIMRALSKTPADRHSDAARFAEALEGGATPLARRGVPGKTIAAIAATIAILAIAIMVARFYANDSPAPLVRRQLTFAGTALLGTLSPDGQFLAFVRQHVDSQNVLVRDVSGGSAANLATVSGGYPGVITLEWSPDGTHVLIGVRGGARVIPRLGGSARILEVPGGREIWAYWLPDGRRVSLHGVLDGNVTIVDLESGDSMVLPIGVSSGFQTEAAWSPDGRMLASATWPIDQPRWSILTTTLDGETVVLVEDTLPLGSPRWSERGDLYFARGANAIQRLRVSTRSGRPIGEPQTVVTDLELWRPQYGHPTFALSPAGDRITYSRGVTYANLWLIHPDAAGGRQIALTTGTLMRQSPTVSPDGQWLAFVQSAGSEGDLHRLGLKDGAEEQLTFGGRVMPDAQIAWSPDGSRLAFQTLVEGSARVAVLDLATRRVRTFPETRASLVTGHLTWAPGYRIAYQAPDHGAVLLLDPLSGRQQQLTGDTTGYFYSPQYSPDGGRLAVGRWREGIGEGRAWLFDLRDGTATEVGHPPWPRGFSPDGRYLYSQEALLPGLWKIDLRAPRRSERLLSPGFRDAECTPAGRLHPDAFICAGFESVADIWMIEGLNP